MSRSETGISFFFVGWKWLAWTVGAITGVGYLNRLSSLPWFSWPRTLLDDCRAMIFPIYDFLGIPPTPTLRYIITFYAIGIAAQVGSLYGIQKRVRLYYPRREPVSLSQFMMPAVKWKYTLAWPIILVQDIYFRIWTGHSLAWHIAREHRRGATKDILDSFDSLPLVLAEFLKYLLVVIAIIVAFTVIDGGKAL